MKHFAHSEFLQAEPASLSARLVARATSDTPQDDHIWLSTLPIAAAIFRLKHGQPVKLSSNRHFDDLLQSAGGPNDLEVGDFAHCIMEMVDNCHTTHFAAWQSADRINRCELDISIAFWCGSRPISRFTGQPDRRGRQPYQSAPRNDERQPDRLFQPIRV
jgi:hypothetical protein